MLFIRTTFFILLAAHWHLGLSCPQSDHSHPTREKAAEIARNNNARRDVRNVPAPKKIAIENVRVFDGEKLLPLRTVFINGDTIVPYVKGADVVDGNGGTLLPGLIDAHTHPSTVDHLETLSSFGVTTTIVASCQPEAICESIQNHTGLTDVRFSGLSANAPNSTHAKLLGLLPNETLTSPSQAPQFVDDQLAKGATFIKIVAEQPDSTTLDQDIMNALVDAAHAKGVRVACHAAGYAAADRALTARVDQLHHVPQDTPTDEPLIARILAQKAVSIPTLSIFRQFVMGGAAPPSAYSAANASAHELYKASVPILAGTDSNSNPTLGLPFGKALHDELELLVGAGMSTVDVLRSATVLAARHNLLFDRGVVAPGMRADLVLISGDPIANISATRDIQRVWIAGIEYEEVAAA
ncbi:putative adenine deaminase [Favolaschia claudopus]|uniref:Adenine deaminase n=1 Tax=Favolaschia claudopus TaxID=2862362 RepID=A0AAW0DWG1_9AGAR